jgi:hypothetical protein
VVKDRPPKKEERRTSVFDFDIPPLWLIQREQSEKDEIYGEVGYGTLLFFTRMVLLHGTSALPEPYWRALDDAINVLGDRSARAHPSQELVERGLVLPAEPCALPDTEIQVGSHKFIQGQPSLSGLCTGLRYFMPAIRGTVKNWRECCEGVIFRVRPQNMPLILLRVGFRLGKPTAPGDKKLIDETVQSLGLFWKRVRAERGTTPPLIRPRTNLDWAGALFRRYSVSTGMTKRYFSRPPASY